jgi:RimJ/RimL family protein N-acetyltransferase
MELRAYTDADLALTEALETDPAVMHHLGGPVPRERLPRVHRLRLADSWWFVITEEPGGPGVGTIGIWEATHDGEAIHETGWMVLPAHQGRGIASRALAMLAERARTEPRFSALHAFPPVSNTPSNALCRKSGFALVGETDVEFAGRPLHCNHWVLATAAPCQLDSGVAGNGEKATGFGG